MEIRQNKIRIKDIALKAGVSTGTVDRVIHGRSGVSETSRQKVGAILEQMNYQPNVYASALAANKSYTFICLLPDHSAGDYWDDVEQGMQKAAKSFSDFNVTLRIMYYDQYETGTFTAAGKNISESKPDGVILSPKSEAETIAVVKRLQQENIPYICIDSTFASLSPLSFFGQHSRQSGYFAARMLSLLAHEHQEVVIFRLVYEGNSGSNQQQEREKGFRESIHKFHPGIQLLELNLFAKQEEANEQLLNDFFSLHPSVSCGVTFNSRAYILGEYMQRHGRTDFHLVGYDLVPRNISCLKSGLIDFIIAQEPSVQGYGSVETLCNHLILKKKAKPLHYMPLTLITIENLEFYLDANPNNE